MIALLLMDSSLSHFISISSKGCIAPDIVCYCAHCCVVHT